MIGCHNFYFASNVLQLNMLLLFVVNTNIFFFFSSTPMMDLLVQITTNHQLQLSNYTLQALGMAPSAEHSDKILPYKPNTPIGTLDTQHIRVVAKSRALPVPKNVPSGHQPFESTFRYVIRTYSNVSNASFYLFCSVTGA